MRVLLVLLLLLAPSASANMADPYTPGMDASEPSQALEGLRVASESLTFDLRPLDATREMPSGGLAIVEAVYRIDNAGDARVVPLDFLALGIGVDSAQVWLDDQPVGWTPVDTVVAPLWWASRDGRRGLDGILQYQPSQNDPTYAPSGFRFSVTLRPGRNVVRVRYGVLAGLYDDGSHPVADRELAYSLAPARRWDGFGDLEVVVLTPDGWDLGASLELGADGDGRYVGTFSGVPADVLKLSARPTAPLALTLVSAGGKLLALLLIVGLGWHSGRLVARTGQPDRRALPGSILGGLLAWGVLSVTASAVSRMADASNYDNTVGTMLFWGPLALIVGSAVAYRLAVRVAKRERRALADGGLG